MKNPFSLATDRASNSGLSEETSNSDGIWGNLKPSSTVWWISANLAPKGAEPRIKIFPWMNVYIAQWIAFPQWHLFSRNTKKFSVKDHNGQQSSVFSKSQVYVVLLQRALGQLSKNTLKGSPTTWTNSVNSGCAPLENLNATQCKAAKIKCPTGFALLRFSCHCFWLDVK